LAVAASALAGAGATSEAGAGDSTSAEVLVTGVTGALAAAPPHPARTRQARTRPSFMGPACSAPRSFVQSEEPYARAPRRRLRTSRPENAMATPAGRGSRWVSRPGDSAHPSPPFTLPA